MVWYKYTFFINWGERCGWTETFYQSFGGTPSQTQVGAAAQAWAAARARVLTVNAVILYARSSPVLNPRRVQVTYLSVNGTIGFAVLGGDINTDVANLAQFVSFNTPGEERRFYLQRGLDDRDIVNGKITYAQNTIARSRIWWNYLKDNGWAMRDFIKDQTIAVTSVSGPTGFLTAGANIPWPDGQLVLVETRTAGSGLKQRWQGKIRFPNLVNAVLRGWRFGDAVGGQISRLTPTYQDLQEWTIPTPNWCRTRQTGRPFDLPRGRQPKRT